jgi:sugar phosphate isomerase/epimerase
MQGKPQDQMTVGIVHFMAFPQCMGGSGPIVETATRIAEDPFFGAIEMGPILESGTRREVREVLKKNNMVVGFGCQPIELANKLDINSLDEATRKAGVAKVKEGIDMAADIGASRVAVLSGPHPGSEKRAAATDALVDSLDQLISYAKSKGINSFALETFDFDIDKKSLIGPHREAAEMSKRVRQKHPEFGLMIDLSHLPLQYETSSHAFAHAGDQVIHIHIGNAVMVPGHKLYGDLHPHFGCEDGQNDAPELTAFLSCLRAIDYIGAGKKNVVAYEVRPWAYHENDNSEWVIANAKQTLERAWAALTPAAAAAR